MTTPTGPLQQLERLALTRSTGEFIAASEDVEVHVYLQGGRVAWGTTTADRFVFRRALIERFGIEEQGLREAVQECFRTRRPLGETLVRWGLATREQVSEGLKAQIEASLRSLGQCAGAQTLFLPRGAQYAEYDQGLTYELEAFLGGARAADASHPPHEVLEQLKELVPELAWAAVLAGGEVQATEGSPPQTAPGLARRLGSDADLLVVRSSRGSAVGGTLEGAGRTALIGLPGEARVGSALGALAALADRPAPHASVCARGAFDTFGDLALDPSGVQRILERAVCPAGAVVLDEAHGPDVWALARSPLDPAELGQAALMRQAVLDLDAFGVRAGSPRSGGAGLAFQVALVADPRWWWFGTDLPVHGRRSVWLALPRATNHGLGWALLSTLARHLSQAEAQGD